MSVVNKINLCFGLLCISSFSFATDTRGYNMMPTGINVIDTQHSLIESKQKSFSGIEGNQIQKTTYIRNTYFFEINGNLAGAYVMLPYSKQHLNITSPVKISKSDSGFSDVKLMFALGLYNMPALNLESFKSFDKNGLHAGCSFTVSFPTGSYNSLSNVNSGTNRRSYKPECAAYFIKDNLQLDFFVGNTVYSENKLYSGSKSLNQKNLYNIETRLSYSFTPSFWASTDLIYFKGGQTKINSVSQKDEQANLNAGVTLSYKIAKSQFVKLIYQQTVSGNDYSPQMNKGVAFTYTLAF